MAVISHTYVVGANRGKLAGLAGTEAIELLVLVPDRWRNRDINNVIEVDAPSSSRYRTAVVRAFLHGVGSLVIYSPVTLFRLLRGFRPHLIYLEEEPWSLAALELCVFSAMLQTRLVFFTWENLDRPLPLPSRLIRRLLLERADGAVAGNQEAKQLLERSRFRKPMTVIPQLGIDRAIFSPGDGAVLPEGFVVGYAGRLVRQKGLMFLLEAMARLAGAKLMLVGRGPLRREIQRRAASLGLDGRVELCENVTHRDVPRYLRRMSVLVLPSLTTRTWKEQFGHVLIEAMACGIPVVGTDSGAIPEVIGDAGIVVREGSVDELVAALTRLKDDPQLRSTLRARGEARVKQEYDNEVISSRLARFLIAV